MTTNEQEAARWNQTGARRTAEDIAASRAKADQMGRKADAYVEFTTSMATLKRVKNYLRSQRGTGDCKDAIARNQAINLLNDAEFSLTGEYARAMIAR